MSRIRTVLSVAIGLMLVASTAGAAQAGPEPLFNTPADAAPGELVTETMRIGPIDLAAQGQPGWDRNMGGAVPMPVGIDGEDSIAIRAIQFDLVDDVGTSLGNDQVHFHHIAFFTPGATDPACPSRGFGHLHLASGAERTPIALPDPYAMRKPNAENWLGNWHVMNLDDHQRDIFIEYTVVHEPGRTDDNTRWVEPWFLDVSGHCGNAQYDVPGDGGPDSTHVQSKTWTMPEAGVIVGTGGHLHDGGIATELRTGDDSLVCRSDVTYADDDNGHEGHATRSEGHHHGSSIERIEPCAVHWGFEAGEELTLDAIYRNDEPAPGAMGINVTFIWWGDQTDGVTSFGDVPPGHDFEREIAWAISDGITTGYDDETFRPTAPVSRQALIAFLHRGFADHDHGGNGDHGGHGHTGRHGHGFSDVHPDNPFADAIAWASAQGLVEGYHDGTFRPLEPVSRQAATAVLHRYEAERYADELWALFLDLFDWA